MSEQAATWRIVTPTSSAGAIACIELTGPGDAIRGALALLAIPRVAPGKMALRNLCGIDTGLVAAWSQTCVCLMPHGGLLVLRELAAALIRAGLKESGPSCDENLLLRFPEAADLHDARMLEALGRARSPRAIELLLDQPRRWREHDRGCLYALGPADSAVLQRLIDPPLVAAVGASNIGKSTLTNALARDQVSIVADEPGTTRDHVGVMLDLDGLVVRFVDTPGIRSGVPEVERRAAELTGEVLWRADLILLCGDACAPPPAMPPGPSPTASPPASLKVALRSDLGTPANWKPDIATCALTSAGITRLGAAIREALVPSGVLEDPRAWPFWSVPGVASGSRGGL